MKKIVFLALLLMSSFAAVAQSVAVPFRVGNKFGLSDSAGNMLLSPVYDILEPSHTSGGQFFVGYTFKGSNVYSHLIYNQKVILSDHPSKQYYLTNDLFVAHDYSLFNNPDGSMNANPFNERCTLYNLEGEIVLEGDFTSILVLDELDEGSKLNEVVITTVDKDDQYTIRVYNKRLGKITKTLLDQPPHLFFRPIPGYYLKYKTPVLIYIYKDKTGAGERLILEPDQDSVKILREKIDLSGIEDNDSDPPPGDIFDRPVTPVQGTGVRKVEVDWGTYFSPKKQEKIVITNDGFKNGYLKVITKNGKKGLVVSKDNQVIISARFDEIIEADLTGSDEGYILRIGTKYGLFIPDEPANLVIEPIFTKIPLLENQDYFKENDPLIKLYDSEGKFFCYANKAGKLYYKAM